MGSLMKRYKKQRKKSGKITPNGILPEKHELDTLLVFTELGYDVELVPISLTPHAKNPDVVIGGKTWEMKSPIGHSKSTLEHCFKKAAHQSENIIIDLRRTKINSDAAISQLKNQFRRSKRVKHMKIVSQKGEILDFVE